MVGPIFVLYVAYVHVYNIAVCIEGPSIKYVTLEGEGVREGMTVCDRGGG